MTLLTTWVDSEPRKAVLRTTDPSEIAAALSGIGVRYEQWPVRDDLPDGSDSATVLAAYRAEVDKLVAEESFTTVDVVSLFPSDAPDWPDTAKAARERFLREHTHDDDDEVRFFVAGAGIFYLHVNGEVHAVYCEKGDLLGVPRGTTHWFDMGTVPAFTAIRFFHEEDGWIGNFTGSDIATRFPDFDEIHAGYRGETP
ncbi:acireductone dioxygenase [Streptomyces sp. NPDC127190]|uniref:1,2-dihydroxy-3-keto-5-methylthiopentene dioxygenase n=1 Tax=unclassified Streptomyces TaxID=2593676 RepID=UPI00362C7E21